jgi:hypothetical protein
VARKLAVDLYEIACAAHHHGACATMRLGERRRCAFEQRIKDPPPRRSIFGRAPRQTGDGRRRRDQRNSAAPPTSAPYLSDLLLGVDSAFVLAVATRQWANVRSA